MSFTCAICSLDIAVGEPLLSDEKMNLAHKSCIDRMLKEPAHPSVTISSTHLEPLPPPAPPLSLPGKSVELARSVSFKVSHGIPVPLDEARRMYGDSCVPSKPPSLCVECQKPAISMCPACHGYVHQDFGYNGPNCSGRHEAHCEGARQFLEKDKKPAAIGLEMVELPIESVRRNGKAALKTPTNGSKKQKRRNR